MFCLLLNTVYCVCNLKHNYSGLPFSDLSFMRDCFQSDLKEKLFLGLLKNPV